MVTEEVKDGSSLRRTPICNATVTARQINALSQSYSDTKN
jgi:hypothetical protein